MMEFLWSLHVPETPPELNKHVRRGLQTMKVDAVIQTT